MFLIHAIRIESFNDDTHEYLRPGQALELPFGLEVDLVMIAVLKDVRSLAYQLFAIRVIKAAGKVADEAFISHSLVLG